MMSPGATPAAQLLTKLMGLPARTAGKPSTEDASRLIGIGSSLNATMCLRWFQQQCKYQQRQAHHHRDKAKHSGVRRRARRRTMGHSRVKTKHNVGARRKQKRKHWRMERNKSWQLVALNGMIGNAPMSQWQARFQLCICMPFHMIFIS